MEVQDFWWEEQLDKLLYDYAQDDFASPDTVKIFILKVIESENSNNEEELLSLLNGKPEIKTKKLRDT
jgi:hypothetical protein